MALTHFDSFLQILKAYKGPETEQVNGYLTQLGVEA
jgi:hypothetical protein